MSELLNVSAGANLNQWAGALAISHPAASRSLGENRLSGLEALDSLGLPHSNRCVSALTDFLNQPDYYFGKMTSEQFYIIAQPVNNSAGRISKSGLDREQTVAFLKQQIQPESQSQYGLILQEYFKNIYGGSIVINSNGRIHGEFKKGKQGPIAKGTATPDYFVTRDPYHGLFRYSFEDPELRTAVYRAIQHIPHYGSGRDTTYHPGYYELALIEKYNDAPLSTIFFDYRKGGPFEISEP